MSEIVATIPKKGMDKKTKKNLIVAGVVLLLLLLAIFGYLYYDKQKQLKGLPTTSDGLTAGQKWNNNGVLTTVI